MHRFASSDESVAIKQFNWLAFAKQMSIVIPEYNLYRHDVFVSRYEYIIRTC
jgi:hypothetical protein